MSLLYYSISIEKLLLLNTDTLYHDRDVDEQIGFYNFLNIHNNLYFQRSHNYH